MKYFANIQMGTLDGCSPSEHDTLQDAEKAVHVAQRRAHRKCLPITTTITRRNDAGREEALTPTGEWV